MGKNKDRVVALDYFRGICIVIVLLGHSQIFSKPFAYLIGAGNLWFGAAEFFFLLSGITFGIIRGPKIKTDFNGILKKTWHRAAQIYFVYVASVLASVFLALYFLSHSVSSYFPELIVIQNAGHAILGTITLTYSFGWTSFLMYFAAFLALAPFMSRMLKTKYWVILPMSSIALYIVASLGLSNLGAIFWFAVWQLYFVMGLVVAEFAKPVVHKLKKAPRKHWNKFYYSILALAGGITAASIAYEFNLLQYVEKLTAQGWLPAKLQDGYSWALAYKPAIDQLLMDSRTGILRPLAVGIVALAAYMVYKKHEDFLLNKTGSFVISMGQNTLWIFIAQALAIPILAALPLPRNLFTNIVLTSVLFGLMWSIAKYRYIFKVASKYAKKVSNVLPRPKYSYDAE